MAVNTLGSLGAPVEATVPAVRMSDGMDTVAIRRGLGLGSPQGLGGRKVGKGGTLSTLFGILDGIGAVSSIAAFLQGIGDGKPQESIDAGGQEQHRHEEDVEASKKCAGQALDVIDQAHEKCAGAAESVVDKVLLFLKFGLVFGGSPQFAALLQVILRAAASFVDTLVRGRNLTVDGCMKTLCQDMEKPALPGNSNKPLHQGGESDEHIPGAGSKGSDEAGECQHTTPLTKTNDSLCEPPPVKPAGTYNPPVQTPQPMQTPQPVEPSCPEKEHSRVTVHTAGGIQTAVQPPAIPPQQVPNILCGHSGAGSAQWHGFFRLLVDLLCPSTDGTGVHAPHPPTEPSGVTQPPPDKVAPPCPPAGAESECDRVQPEPAGHKDECPEDKPKPPVTPEPAGHKDECPTEKPSSEKPSAPPINDKAPSDGYHGFDKTQHPSYPGSTGEASAGSGHPGGVVVDNPSADKSPSPVAPAPKPDPSLGFENAPGSEHTPESKPEPAHKPDPVPEQTQKTEPAPKSVNPPAPSTPESWSPDIWVSAGVSAEVQAAGNDISLELAGAAEFGVDIERSGAW
ncbi:hypothetical protein [Corynebacterium auriscanis]|uniref:hypothetical protein n=1 Tax=Corynebacterium auriscanis TaxID=99807 RepID=UPI003CE86AEA